MAFPKTVTLIEVGPREGFQFEGIGQPDRIATADKISLIEMLAGTGLKTIQMSSFVSPKQVPQMADAEQICAAVTPHDGVRYTGIYLNDTGLKRAIATGKLHISGKISMTASETFSLRNQRRTLAEDKAMQRKVAALYRENGYQVTNASVMAAFGCNYEGDVSTEKVLSLVEELQTIASEVGSQLNQLVLADTMGQADPGSIHRLVGAVRDRWPALRIGMHLHDTRGMAIANTFAALEMGVDLFDTAVAGLGGCPFAGHKGAAGNVCSEEVVFLCHRLGIETGVDLAKLVECARFAETIVGHSLPSKLISASLTPQMPAAQAA
jgi:hydroxymethylglutaryl-CoA lyase